MATKIDLLGQHLTTRIASELGIAHHDTILRCIQRRLPVIIHDLAGVYTDTRRHTLYESNENIKIFEASKRNKTWGTLDISKGVSKAKQHRLVKLLGPHLFITYLTGYSNKSNLKAAKAGGKDAISAGSVASAIEIKYQVVVDAIEEYLIELEFIFIAQREWKTQVPSGPCFRTRIDIDSLGDYVDSTQRQLREDDFSHVNVNARTIYRKKLMRNLRDAVRITRALDDQGELRQELRRSESNRIYLGGVNLQTAPKELRLAALGRADGYDMKCGAMGIIAALAANLDPTQAPFTYILDYIEKRVDIRIQIAKDLFNLRANSKTKDSYQYNLVKEAITSIGFGAKRTAGSCWQDADGKWQCSSLQKTLKGKVDDFLNHPLVKNLLDDYQRAAKVVRQAYKCDINGFKQYVDDFAPTQESLSNNRLTAHIYQVFEIQTLLWLIEKAEQQGANLLLPLHDGAYFDKDFNLDLAFATMPLDDIDDWKYIQFEHTKYLSHYHRSRGNELEAAHKRHMTEENEIANAYAAAKQQRRLCEFAA